LVPKDHILREIDRAIDFSFIYDMVKDYYCADNGRPSIDPVVLFKIVLIQYTGYAQCGKRSKNRSKRSIPLLFRLWADRANSSLHDLWEELHQAFCKQRHIWADIQ